MDIFRKRNLRTSKLMEYMSDWGHLLVSDHLLFALHKRLCPKYTYQGIRQFANRRQQNEVGIRSRQGLLNHGLTSHLGEGKNCPMLPRIGRPKTMRFHSFQTTSAQIGTRLLSAIEVLQRNTDRILVYLLGS